MAKNTNPKLTLKKVETFERKFPLVTAEFKKKQQQCDSEEIVEFLEVLQKKTYNTIVKGIANNRIKSQGEKSTMAMEQKLKSRIQNITGDSISEQLDKLLEYVEHSQINTLILRARYFFEEHSWMACPEKQGLLDLLNQFSAPDRLALSAPNRSEIIQFINLLQGDKEIYDVLSNLYMKKNLKRPIETAVEKLDIKELLQEVNEASNQKSASTKSRKRKLPSTVDLSELFNKKNQAFCLQFEKQVVTVEAELVVESEVVD